MGNPFDAFPEVAAAGAPQPPQAPRAMAASIWDAYPEAPKAPTATQTPPREASGLLESIQAGVQGSAPGLMWRRKLPDLFINPETANWWERLASGVGQIGAELPLMVGGAIAGAPVGAAIGGGPVGGLLGAGFGMGAVPATIRTAYMEALKAGEVKDAADFWRIAGEVATQALKEGTINAAAMGAGAFAKAALATRAGATAEASRAIAVGAASPLTQKAAIGYEATDLATQIASMTTMAAWTQGHLYPSLQEVGDAAILIGGLKGAHVTAKRIMDVYEKTGKTPAEQAADAQRDPTIAADLAKPPEPKPGPEVPRGASGEVDMPKIQEQLFRETARIDELQAMTAPLSDAERVELDGLKTKVTDLEAQLAARAAAPNVEEIITARYAPEQLTEAKTTAEARAAELTTAAETRVLTDTERAERSFLANSLNNPEALARHFKIEPAVKGSLTAEARDASAQKVYDDVLGQLKAADEARQAAGLKPLGDDHAEAVATLVRARVRTRAARLGMLPEEVYNEKPLQIRDETAAEVAAAAAAIPADAVMFVPPEVDLFGDPVQVTNAPRHAVENLATSEIPLANLVLSKEVPQFKNAADANGVVAPLGGSFDRTGVGPIQVWERLDGTLEVISGRHRLDLARRTGEETIPAQIHREADGFTAKMAAALDAELNIRDEQGSVADYAQYFKDSGKTREAADLEGLLGRAKGKAGFAIARDASPDLLAAHRAGKLSDEAALSISSAAPGSERLQALGIASVNNGKSILVAVNTMKAVDWMAADRMAKGAQGDIFGFDDSAMQEAAAMAKKASSKQRAISEQIAAVSGASKRPELARKLGVDVQDPEGIQKKIVELKQEQYLWDNWPLYPDLVAKLRELKQGPVDETSPEFRKFIEDTKAVDADGNPLLVYHGTRSDIIQFREDKIRKRLPDNGFYFTDSPGEASDFATGSGLTPAAGNVMPVYLSLKNPLMHDFGGERFTSMSLFNIVKEARESGNDGVIVTNIQNFERGPTSTTYIVFKDTQIKSQFNRGTWDAEDPNILHQAETPSEAAKRDDEAVAQAVRRMAGPDSPGFGVAAGNALGFWPDLRVRVQPGLRIPDKPQILQATNNLNAPRQLAALDPILDAFRNATDTIQNWTAMMAHAFASREVPVPPYAFIRDINGPQAVEKLRRLTAGQIADADHGFQNAAEFRRAYTAGELGVETTGKLFMWSFLSRGVSPYTQESLFIDAFKGADEWIAKAARGEFTEADFPAYTEWAKSVAPAGSGQPGSGATHNLNAFGRNFLFKMGQMDADGKSHLQRLHDMMADPNTTGREIRREFAKFGEGVGIDNKVVSFTLLVAGHADVMVLDRVQIRNLWDDGRFGDINLYDGATEKRMVQNQKTGKLEEQNAKIAGSALTELAEGVRGLLVYEALERGLAAKLPEIYGALGRPQDASLGRYHWETWVAASEQEASHGTLGAILRDAKGDDIAIGQVSAKQGEYGAYEYGAEYHVRDGSPGFDYRTPSGKQYEFSVPAFRAFLDAVRDTTAGGPGIIPRGFLVTNKKKAADGKLVEVDAGYSNRPWYDRPGVNNEKLDELASKWADRSGGSGEGERALAETAAAKAPADRERSPEEVAFANEGNPNLLYQSDKPDTWYYSALARGVDTAQMKAAPAQGWKDWVKGQTGKGAIKADEIKWSGLEEWLDIQQGRVTKEQVADYLKSGGVRVEEKMLGEQKVIDRATQAELSQQLDGLEAERANVGFRIDRINDEVRDSLSKLNSTDRANAPWWVREAAEGNADSQKKLDALGIDEKTVTLLKEQADLYGRAGEIKAKTGEIRDALNEMTDSDNTKFSQYVLPGAKQGTYRELLLTLPERYTYAKAEPLSWDENSRAAVLTQKMRKEGNLPAAEMAEWQALRDKGRAHVDELEELRKAGKNQDPFRSSHFDQPNILAHIRFNERTDADGKRVLFVEEIQSDWAQKGRESGFKGESQNYKVREEKDGTFSAADEYDSGEGGFATRAEAQAWADAENRRDPTAVPSAPFVEKTSAWTALAVKRMIRYAAENGFDKIAWTRGEQQVDRYTSALRKAVDVVEWKKTEEGIQLVGYKGPPKMDADIPRAAQEAIGKNLSHWKNAAGEPFENAWEVMQFAVANPDTWANTLRTKTSEQQVAIQTYVEARKMAKGNKVVDTTEKESALSDAIGKSMAEKIIQDPNQSGTIEGKDIKIDDTGMAGFYDRMLPSIAKEVLKKLGGGKVGEAELGGKKDPTEGWKLVENEAGNFEIIDPEGNLADIADSRRTGEEAIRHFAVGDDIGRGEIRPPGFEVDGAYGSGKIGTQPSFDITPAMRDKAMEGLPLFQNEAANARGSFQIAANLITTMQGADKSTVVHELGHSWLEEMKADALRENAPLQIKADWDILRAELAIGSDGQISRESHEQWARTVERYLAEGEAPSVELRGVFDRFKAWLLEIYNSLGNLRAEVNPELKGILDRMLATDQEIAMAKELDVPRAYVPEANAARIAAIVPPEQRAKILPGFEAERAAMEPFTDELPTGPGEAPDTTRVNYQYINAPEDVKRAMQGLAEIDQANIQKRRGGVEGVESWEATNEKVAKEMADVLEGDPRALDRYVNEVLGASASQPKVNEVLRRMKIILTGAAKDSAARRDVILAKGLDASIKEQLEYLGSLERLRMIQNEFLGQRAAVARALNQLKDTTEGTGEVGRMLEAIGVGADDVLLQSGRTPEQEQAAMKASLDEILLRYKDKSGNLRTPLDIAKLHKEIGSLKGSFKLAETMEKAGTWEKFVEGWKAGLLSGPQTPVVNLFGTASFEYMRPAVDALAAIIGMARGASPGMGESDRASMSEAVARLTGMTAGIQDGLKVGYAALKVDQQTGKVEAYRPAIEGRLGEVIRIPYRLMAAGDQITTTMYMRGELATLAIRQAFDEGLSPNSREFAERVQALKDKPTPEMQAVAETAAARMTFNNPGGEKMRATQAFVSKWHLEWMVPFIRTPLNVAEEMLRMSPFAPAVSSWRADIAKGGVARDRAIAELTLGAGIMALTTAYAFSGQISGSGSPDPGKNRAKAGVWQNNSILIGDTWYEYGRIQPVGTLMALAADMATTWDMMNDEERDKIPKMLALAFSNAITNQTFLQGITNVVHLMSEPDRYGGRFLQGLAGSMVPNVIGQPTAMSDPYVRQVNSMLEAVQSRIPGLRQDLAPKIDWLGEPVPTKERVGVVGPSRTQKVSEDKVRQEADRLGISVADAPKKTQIGKGTGKTGQVEFTPEERTKFAQIGGEFAHKILGNIVNAEGYDAIPDRVKKQIFSKVMTAAHKVAAIGAMPPEKRMAYLQEITEKVAQELTPGVE